MNAPRVQCKAKSKSTGKRCSRFAMLGQAVCASHGGRAPQCLKSARERIQAMVAPALSVMERRLEDEEQPQLQMAAAKDLLDRAGYSARAKVEVTGAIAHTVKADFSEFSDDELELFQRLTARALRGGDGGTEPPPAE